MVRGTQLRRRLLTFWPVLLALLLPLLSPWAWAEQRGPVTEATLENGLKVLLLEEHKAPVVTLQLWYGVGGRNEQVGRTGLAHLLEHMMFKGTSRFGPEEFSRTIQRNGGQDNAFTSKDVTVYFTSLAANRIGIPLAMEADRMINLTLNPKEFDLEREVVKEERRLRTEDNPVSSLIETMRSVAFVLHPYRTPVIGWMADLDRLRRDDLQAFYRTYYVPNNAVLIAVGDFKAAELLEQIRGYFGGIPAGSPPPPVEASEPPQQGERRLVLNSKVAKLPFVAIGYHVPNLKEADSYALDVLETLLSGGKSARLYRRLVHEQQLALEAEGDYSRLSLDPDLFYLYAQLHPGSGKDIAQLERALLQEIERLKQEPVSERELQKVKNQLEAAFLLRQDSNFSRAMLLGQYEAAGGWRQAQQYVEGIRGVTAAQIQQVVKRYFVEDNRTVAVLRPLPAEGAEGIQRR